MDFTFPTLYKRTELMYLGEFEEEVVYSLTENIYRQELLKLFGEEIFNAEIVDKKVEELYEMLKANEKVQELIAIIEEIYGDRIFSFAVLFSYDYFYLFYPCIQDVLNNKEPDTKELIEKINL